MIHVVNYTHSNPEKDTTITLRVRMPQGVRLLKTFNGLTHIFLPGKSRSVCSRASAKSAVSQTGKMYKVCHLCLGWAQQSQSES